MDAAQPSGAPYLHALGAQYVAPGAALAHDTNAADFAAGTLKSNVDLTTNPGAVANAGGLQPGPVSVDDFSSDIIASGAWAWDNPTNPSGNSAYSFTENPGWLRIRINKNENLWKGAANKYYVLARRAKHVSGDWEIETYINFPNGRTSGHQMGLGVFQDANNLILFGPSDSSTGAQQMVALRIENDATDQRLVGIYAQTAFTLRIRKVGNRFYCYARPDGVADFTLIYTHTSNTIVTPYIGVMGKSFSPATETDFPVDYDSFSYTPLDPNGAFVSRPLDLGQTGLTPWVETLGGNAAAVQILWRAADTEAGLASAAWVGADAANAPFAGTYTGLLPNSLAGKRFLQYQAVLPQGTSLNDIMLLGLTGVILPLTRDDAMAALRIAGGLVAATPDQVSRYDLVKGDSDGKVVGAWIADRGPQGQEESQEQQEPDHDRPDVLFDGFAVHGRVPRA
jgi:hypothetical protein